jgi:DNA-binding transcriptional LysR family regulator
MAVAPYVRRGGRRPAQLAAVSYVEGVRLPLRNVEDRMPDGRVALRTNSITTVLDAVRLGWGAGDLPCFVGDEMPELERAFPAEKPDSLDVWLIVHADVQRTARVRVLVDELARVFREGATRLSRAEASGHREADPQSTGGWR